MNTDSSVCTTAYFPGHYSELLYYMCKFLYNDFKIF